MLQFIKTNEKIYSNILCNGGFVQVNWRRNLAEIVA